MASARAQINTVTLANKNARIVWALRTHNRGFHSGYSTSAIGREPAEPHQGQRAELASNVRMYGCNRICPVITNESLTMWGVHVRPGIELLGRQSLLQPAREFLAEKRSCSGRCLLRYSQPSLSAVAPAWRTHLPTSTVCRLRGRPVLRSLDTATVNHARRCNQSRLDPDVTFGTCQLRTSGVQFMPCNRGLE